MNANIPTGFSVKKHKVSGEYRIRHDASTMTYPVQVGRLAHCPTREQFDIAFDKLCAILERDKIRL